MTDLEKEIIYLTEKMMAYNEEALIRLQAVMEQESYKTDFHNEVKPYVDGFSIEVEKWSQACRKWILQIRPKYVHVLQIETTRENLHHVVLQSFYKDTKLFRVKQMYQANRYVLDSVQKALQK